VPQERLLIEQSQCVKNISDLWGCLPFCIRATEIDGCSQKRYFHLLFITVHRYTLKKIKKKVKQKNKLV